MKIYVTVLFILSLASTSLAQAAGLSCNLGIGYPDSADKQYFQFGMSANLRNSKTLEFGSSKFEVSIEQLTAPIKSNLEGYRVKLNVKEASGRSSVAEAVLRDTPDFVQLVLPEFGFATCSLDL